MSVMTGRGDSGETDLLYGRRVAKASPRVEALGAIDELNTGLGLVRCHSGQELVKRIDWIQGRLVGLMGELAVLPADWTRYQEDGMPIVSQDDVLALENWGRDIEKAGVRFEGWARPGASGSLAAAFLDQARTICRRAERRVLELGKEASQIEVRLFLNRLSDFLWLSARWEETDRGA
ncbi:MAG: cob(I)yrinic acid a,c-diamide adenosyltransferase [Verrucomicrobiota bacterium JB023]|nr:cob(I)yrinic acid a,c-diamide adenosyltransferase [Verrucomicrobiota bacterium JB023]